MPRKPPTKRVLLNPSGFSFDPRVVTQRAVAGTPLATLAVSMGIIYDKLPAQEKKAFNWAYEQGVAQGIGNVFNGLNKAAADGDTKAAQMLIDFLGVTPAPAVEGAKTPRPRRLLVEVSVADDE